MDEENCCVCLEILRHCATGKAETCLHELCLQCMFRIADNRGIYKCPLCRMISNSYYIIGNKDPIKFHTWIEIVPIPEEYELSEAYYAHNLFLAIEEMTVNDIYSIWDDDIVDFNEHINGNDYFILSPWNEERFEMLSDEYTTEGSVYNHIWRTYNNV